MFREKISRNQFVYTCEILPPKDGNHLGIFSRLEGVADHFDGLNLPSCPLGRLRAHSLSFGYLLQKELSVEAIVHFTGRHHTVLSFESELLGAHLLGIRNVLCVTGDKPLEGRAFSDLNSITLLRIARNMNQGLTEAREALKTPPDFLLCSDYNPNVANIEAENRRALEKHTNGARVFFTQPVFNVDRFIDAVGILRTFAPESKVIAGLSYLHNKKLAMRLQKFLGIPYDYINSLEQDETGLLVKTAQRIRGLVDGFYVIPVGVYEKARELAVELKSRVDIQQ